MRLAWAAVALSLAASPALGQTTDIDAFKDGADEAKVHTSGFVCPLYIGHFERDAYGERDPGIHSDFCVYSALDGVYGTITLMPLSAPYDPKTALAGEFAEQEGIGGRIIGESTVKIGSGKSPVSVYNRIYETAALETLHYRILFATGTVGNWAVEATIEFATPRDDDKQRAFLDAVFTEALTHIAKAPQPVADIPTQPASPLVGPSKPR